MKSLMKLNCITEETFSIRFIGWTTPLLGENEKSQWFVPGLEETIIGYIDG